MNSFLVSLRQVATLLARFSETRLAGSLEWDGTRYAPTDSLSADPQAAKWWGVLTAIDGMLMGQHRIPALQKQYLEQVLFGGMGSLNDFVFDEDKIGPGARQVNGELEALRRQLHDEFRGL